MKVAFRLSVFLCLLSGAAYAQNNPYLPSPGYSGGTDPFINNDQRQQFLQNMLLQAEGGGGQTPAQQPQQTPEPAPKEEFQELRSQQTDDMDAIAREKADREQEIQVLKDAFGEQIRALQMKIDEQQAEIDNLRYQNH